MATTEFTTTEPISVPLATTPAQKSAVMLAGVRRTLSVSSQGPDHLLFRGFLMCFIKYQDTILGPQIISLPSSAEGAGMGTAATLVSPEHADHLNN